MNRKVMHFRNSRRTVIWPLKGELGSFHADPSECLSRFMIVSRHEFSRLICQAARVFLWVRTPTRTPEPPVCIWGGNLMWKWMLLAFVIAISLGSSARADHQEPPSLFIDGYAGKVSYKAGDELTLH